MKKTTLFIGLALTAMTMNAQTQGGGIIPDMLKQIEVKTTSSVAEKAIANAIATNSINDLAKNPATQGVFDTHFSDATPSQNIHDQKSSGRCWMFSGFNVLRSRFALANNDTLAVEYSHDYLFFYDQLEKANLFLQGIIDNADKPMDDPIVRFFFKAPLSDGGTFCGVADLADKYGLVPKCVQPETYQAENTRLMAQLIERKLRQFGLELRKMAADKTAKGKAKASKGADMQKRKTEMLAVVYKMLCLTLGEPVKEFTYVHRDKYGNAVGEPKKYTPKSFYEETVKGPLTGSFVMLMNDPRHPYYKVYEVEYDRHTYDGHNWRYINLPMEEIEKIAIASIKDGKKMYSSYDVAKQFDRTRGYMNLNNYDYATLLGVDFPMNKAERIETFDSGSTHAMTLTAVDLDKKGTPIKWKVENSWGSSSGQAGCAVMEADWFREYMFRLVADRQYVPENILKIEAEKPVMLMPDDPLFGQDD